MSPQKSEWLRRHAPWFAIAIVSLAAVTLAFVAVYKVPENMAAPTFGTAWAPYSDALGPWLEGGLSFLFGIPAPDYLYRPTVGLFWGSILAATGRVEMIPLLFTVLLLGMFAATTLLEDDTRLRNAVIVALGICALGFPQIWSLIYISSTSVDLPALALTGTAMLLLLSGRGGAAYPALLAGCACLGIVAAIRGPMMLAGIPIIAVRVLLIERAPARIILAAAVAFLLPIVIDSSLQRYLGVVNNGVVGVYCVYHDPTHTWTAACHAAYLANPPPAGQVVRDYLGFLFSGEGRNTMYNSLNWRLSRDFAPMLATASLAFVGLAGVLAAWSERAHWRKLATSPLVRAAAMVSGLVALRALGAGQPWGALAFVLAALAAAVALRLWGAVMVLVGYLLATIFLCLVGVPSDRLQHTFSVCLYLSIGLLVMETRQVDPAEGWRHARALRRLVPIAVTAALVLLYLGSYIFPSTLRDTYQAQVRGRSGVAIKLTGDPRIDRSLYYSGQGIPFYTTHDSHEVGFVRKYSRLETPSVSNDSFVNPNRFVD